MITADHPKAEDVTAGFREIEIENDF